MPLRGRLRRVAGVVCSVLAAAAIVPAQVGAAGETYGEFSLMDQRAAGQLWSGGSPASQWAWNPRGGGESHIRWDAPNEWEQPPSNVEHFVHEGDWVYLHGWEDLRAGVYYTQHVTSELIGDADCRNMTPLPDSGGRQHYVRWDLPGQPYCLLAKGYITGSNGTRVEHFEHRQVWYPPGECATRHFGQVRCLKQTERWADDNGHPWRVTVERDNYLGKGLGMGLMIEQRVKDGKPSPWHADLRHAWRY